MYFEIVLVGIGVLLFFRLLSHLKKILPFSKKVKHFTGFTLPVIELISWLGFVLWCLNLIYEAEAYSTLIVFGVLIVFLFATAWFFIRDFLHGLQLKIQRKIEIDSKIEIGNLKGIVLKADYFTFDIKTEDGNIHTIPYNKISSEIISKNASNIHLQKQTISFQIQSKQDINQIISGLKLALINAPWAAASQEPIIKLINSETGIHLLDAVVYILEKEHAGKIEDYVKRNFIAKIS